MYAQGPSFCQQLAQSVETRFEDILTPKCRALEGTDGRNMEATAFNCSQSPRQTYHTAWLRKIPYAILGILAWVYSLVEPYWAFGGVEVPVAKRFARRGSESLPGSVSRNHPAVDQVLKGLGIGTVDDVDPAWPQYQNPKNYRSILYVRSCRVLVINIMLCVGIEILLIPTWY